MAQTHDEKAYVKIPFGKYLMEIWKSICITKPYICMISAYITNVLAEILSSKVRAEILPPDLRNKCGKVAYARD